MWRTDGTAAGTRLVESIAAQADDPASLTNVNGVLFFVARNRNGGCGLWRSEGSPEVTVLVKNFFFRAGGCYGWYDYPGPMHLTNVNGTLFFAALDYVHGHELWKSDGTEAGTVLVKDIFAGEGSSYPGFLTNVNGTLYFVADDGVHGPELWKSDGTEAGTVLVKDINPGPSSSEPSSLVSFAGALFFFADDGQHGSELWRSDGSEAGTALVKDVDPGPAGLVPLWISSLSPDLTNMGGMLYFAGADGSGYGLWKSDGTADGTTRVRHLSGGGRLPLESLVNADGVLFFVVHLLSGYEELWRSDGTEGGTTVVTTISWLWSDWAPRLTAVNDAVFFFADDDAHGCELWKSDGTSAGTALTRDISPGVVGCRYMEYFPQYIPALADANGTLLFSADDGSLGRELWKSDGTEAGTVLVKDINAARSRTSDALGLSGGWVGAVNGVLLFTADDGAHGSGLWRSDGTEAGTLPIAPIRSARLGTVTQGTLFFGANDGSRGTELWKSDGTVAGAALVKDIVPGSDSSWPDSFTEVNGTLFFTASDPQHGRELWKSDGTPEGTVLVKDIVPGASGSSPAKLIALNGTLFLLTGGGLWKSDGTEAGTVLVKGLDISARGVLPADGAIMNGMLFFRANDGTHGHELWRSDGTTAGTALVKDINPGPHSSVPSLLGVIGNALMLEADDGVHGAELWRSDGTEAGTELVKDIGPDPWGWEWPFLESVVVKGLLVFAANDGTHGPELWRSDGTTAGTMLVKDIDPRPAEAIETLQMGLTDAAGKLIFTAFDGVHGYEPWQSNGTTAGTRLVQDIAPGAVSSDPSYYFYQPQYFVAGSHVFFTANDGQHGRELWAIPLAALSSSSCVGDCDANYTVTVDELVKGVNIALGVLPPDVCSAFDSNHDRAVTVDELVIAVNNALSGCK